MENIWEAPFIYCDQNLENQIVMSGGPSQMSAICPPQYSRFRTGRTLHEPITFHTAYIRTQQPFDLLVSA